MSTRLFFLLLAGLLAFYLGGKLFSDQPKDSRFDTDLIRIDTSRVTSIAVYPEGGDEALAFQLTREQDFWIATKGGISTRALIQPVNALLGCLSLVKTSHIAAKTTEKWSEFDVQEGGGTLIQVFDGDQILEEFIIGGFTFNQQARTAVSFIRLRSEPEVYAINGLEISEFMEGFDTYRNKAFLEVRVKQLDSIQWHQPDQQQSWRIDTAGIWFQGAKPVADSIAWTRYLEGLSGVMGQAFDDGFSPMEANHDRAGVLSFFVRDEREPIEVIYYLDTLEERPFTFLSSQHPDAYFSSDSTGLYQQLIEPLFAN
jgi:hypothetical protein